jgi:tRNA G18 (ribose-2'-O)-methylase SpoU
VAEGEKVVRRLLESHLTVVSALMPEKWVGELAPLLQARPENIPVFLAPKLLLEQLIGFTMFQGVMAVGRSPQPVPLEEVLSGAARPHLLVALEGLTNAENLGVVVRNCVAFGVQALVVGETSSTPYLRRAVRNSMGTLFKLPIVEPRSLVDALCQLRPMGLRKAPPSPGAISRMIVASCWGAKATGFPKRCWRSAMKPSPSPWPTKWIP